MSSSYGSSTSGRGRGQPRFVPKGSSSSTISSAPSPLSRDTGPPPRPRLTTPLRSPSPAAPQVDGDKGQKREQLITFVNYLPQDEAVASGLSVDNGGLDAVESQAVVDILNDELSSLLRLKPREFWKQVASNSTLIESLDSYLLFRNRWYDFPHRGAKGVVAGVVVGEGELSRRVFMTFYRMSSNTDPGASTHDCLSAKEHTALMQEKKLLDLPKLLDICAIYGHDNEDLTRSLVNNAMKAQPGLAETLPNTCYQFLKISHTMHQRCSSSLEVLASNDVQGVQRHGHFHSVLLEVMDFLNDAIVTLDAFIDAYKPAAFYFSCPVDTSTGDQDLLKTLGRLHDSLLPILQQAFVLLSSDKDQSSSNLSLKVLSTRILKFGWKLLQICYLSHEVHEDGLHQTCTKMFPFQVDDPLIRGDILVQTIKDINSGSSNSLEQSQCYGTFLQNIEKNYYILSRIDSLRSNGWVVLDDEQFHWLSHIAMPPSNVRMNMPEIPVSSASSKETMDEDAVFMESKISQIKDIFPDYGKGFLSACLDVYNQNPEEVIQRILEGTLHKDLLSLDTSLEQISAPKTASHDIDAKGKGLLLEPTDTIRKDKGKGVLLDASSVVVGSSSLDRGGGDASFPSSHGRYTRKSKNEVLDSEVLDSKAAKDSVRSTVLAAAEYEDEYDDSFDDLGLSVVEPGTEEADVMGDDSGSLPGRSSVPENQNSGPRWASQKKPQFYVKDGKNYSYKVSGSVAASNAREAAILNLAQKDMIHGLGRGGNFPLGATKLLPLEEDVPDDSNAIDSGSRGNSYSRGRGTKQGNYRGRGHGRNIPVRAEELADSDGQVQEETDSTNSGGRGNSNFRGRGRRGGNYHRKNLAMKKHFAGLTGS